MSLSRRLIPFLFFAAAGVAMRCAPPQPEHETIQQAVEGTVWGTVLQHACSLFSHAGFRVSARLSHAIWFVDYAGILLNFIWTTPSVACLRATPDPHSQAINAASSNRGPTRALRFDSSSLQWPRRSSGHGQHGVSLT